MKHLSCAFLVWLVLLFPCFAQSELRSLLVQSLYLNQELDSLIQKGFREMSSGRMSKREAAYYFLELKESAELSRDQILRLADKPEWLEVDKVDGLLVQGVWIGQVERLQKLVRACSAESDLGKAKSARYWNDYRRFEKEWGATKTRAYSVWLRGGCDN